MMGEKNPNFGIPKSDEIKKKLDETKALNKELESPLNLEDTKALEESIDNELKNASEEVKSGKKGKSQESQQQAADQMEQLKRTSHWIKSVKRKQLKNKKK